MSIFMGGVENLLVDIISLLKAVEALGEMNCSKSTGFGNAVDTLKF